MIDAILDTNILVAGLRSKSGAAFQLLRAVAEGNLRPHVSVSLALEYEDVLKRPALISGFTEADLDRFLADLLSAAVLWTSIPSVRPSLRDPDDERILELAVLSRVTVVTHNVRDFDRAVQFGVRVVTPADMVHLLRRAEA